MTMNAPTKALPPSMLIESIMADLRPRVGSVLALSPISDLLIHIFSAHADIVPGLLADARAEYARALDRAAPAGEEPAGYAPGTDPRNVSVDLAKARVDLLEGLVRWFAEVAP